MADKKISALGAMTAPAIADFLHVIDDNSGTYTNQKITLATLLTLAPIAILDLEQFNQLQDQRVQLENCDITSAVTQITSTGADALSLTLSWTQLRANFFNFDYGCRRRQCNSLCSFRNKKWVGKLFIC